MKKLLIVLVVFQLFGCKPEAQSIKFGKDKCVHCKMTISDNRYGAELVSKQGKNYKYDAVECLVNSLHEHQLVQQEDVFSLWVIDFSNPGTLVAAEQCSYLLSPALPSPMGMNITAVSTKAKADELLKQHGGKISNWEEAKVAVLMQNQISQ